MSEIPRSGVMGGAAGWLALEEMTRLTEGGTDAYRLFSSAEGWAERLGEDFLLSYQNEQICDRLLAGAQQWGLETGTAPQRIFGKLLPRQNAERVTPVLLAGKTDLPLTIIVRENGVRYGLDFGAGYSAGLFLDQRRNRAWLRAHPGKRLLNTFAYTCSFSVVAALGGAETLSVDLSRKSLDRGRANFALNAIDPAGHRFLAEDVMELLPRLARRGEQFDGIILDPPTFSRGFRGRRFQVESDFEKLLLAALEVATPTAALLLSTNCTRLDRRVLERIARFALKTHRRAGSFHVEPALPDIPSAHAATTLWLRLR